MAKKIYLAVLIPLFLCQIAFNCIDRLLQARKTARNIRTGHAARSTPPLSVHYFHLFSSLCVGLTIGSLLLMPWLLAQVWLEETKELILRTVNAAVLLGTSREVCSTISHDWYTTNVARDSSALYHANFTWVGNAMGTISFPTSRRLVAGHCSPYRLFYRSTWSRCLPDLFHRGFILHFLDVLATNPGKRTLGHCVRRLPYCC